MVPVSSVPVVTSVLNGNDDSKMDVPFDEAMTLTGCGKFNIFAVIFCGFMLLGMIMETLGFSYIIPACQCDLELDLVQKGWLAAIPFIGIVITSYMWGYLADTRGRKKILMICMAVGSFFSILSSFSPDLITFAALRFIAGLFIAGPSALGYAYLGELSPLKERDKMMTLGNASVALGTAIVPLIAWGILPTEFKYHLAFLGFHYRPWRLLVCLFAMPFVVCAIVISQYPESPKYLMSSGEPEKALDVLRYIYSVNTGKKPEEFPVWRLKKEECVYKGTEIKQSIFASLWNQTAPLFKGRHLMYTAILCYLQFTNFATTNGFYIWYPAILNKMLDSQELLNPEMTNMCSVLEVGLNTPNYIQNVTDLSKIVCDDALVTGAFTYSITLASIFSAMSVSFAFSLKYIGKKNLLMGIYFISATCALSLHWITNTIVSILVFSLMQICGTCIGVATAFAVEVFPTNYRAMAVCLTLMVGRVGSVAGTNAIGLLIESMCPVCFFSFSVLLFGSFAICFALPSRKVKPKKPTVHSQEARPYSIS